MDIYEQEGAKGVIVSVGGQFPQVFLIFFFSLDFLNH